MDRPEPLTGKAERPMTARLLDDEEVELMSDEAEEEEDGTRPKDS